MKMRDFVLCLGIVFLCSGNMGYAQTDDIFEAVKSKNITKVVEIIEESPFKSAIRKQDNDGNTPLMYAAAIGDLNMVKCLVEHGAKVNVGNKNGQTPIMLAVSMGIPNLIKKTAAILPFLRKLSKVHHEEEAARHGPDFTDHFLVNLAVNGIRRLNYAKHERYLNELAKKYPTDNLELMEALKNKGSTGGVAEYSEIVKYLVGNGGSVSVADAIGRTALTYAVQVGNGELVELFINIAKQALNEERIYESGFKDFINKSPVSETLLYYAVYKKRFRAAAALINAGAALKDSEYHNDYPIYCAVEDGDIEAIKCFFEALKSMKMIDRIRHKQIKEPVNDKFRTYLDDESSDDFSVDSEDTKKVEEISYEEERELSDIEKIKRYIDKGPSDETPLDLAVKQKESEIALFLIENGAGIKASTIYNAAESSNLEVLQKLIEKNQGKNLDKEQLLDRAIKSGNLETTSWVYDYLISSGVTVDVNKIFYSSLQSDSFELSQWSYNLITDKSGINKAIVFESISDMNTMSLIQWVLDSIIREDLGEMLESGSNALYIAAQKGNLNKVALLLQRGFNGNVEYDGKRLIHCAAESGSIDLVVWLLRQNLPLNDLMQKDQKGCLPLHHAAKSGSRELVSFILQRCGRSIVDVQDKKGNTPLHSAARGGSEDVARCLVYNGANALAVNKKNKYPYQVAKGNSSAEKYLFQLYRDESGITARERQKRRIRKGLLGI